MSPELLELSKSEVGNAAAKISLSFAENQILPIVSRGAVIREKGRRLARQSGSYPRLTMPFLRGKIRMTAITSGMAASRSRGRVSCIPMMVALR